MELGSHPSTPGENGLELPVSTTSVDDGVTPAPEPAPSAEDGGFAAQIPDAEIAAQKPVAAGGAVATLPARVGVLLVHGIGEQRRFEHLEQQTKLIAKALLEREARTNQKTEVTLEIIPAAGGAPYQSQQDSWMGGRFAAVRAVVKYGASLEHETHLHFHEVWWADSNERYDLAKQLRFWGWGLAMWTIPSRMNSQVAGFQSAMKLPFFPSRRLTAEQRVRLSNYNRWQLFMTAWIFLVSSLSVTLAVFVLKRLNFGVLSPIDTFVNYISAVKLYTQSRRTGGGPLDGIKEPPRFTIRRRMVRALVDVATADYDRWYVLAHSLGPVVAFNGLMTHAHSIPNYLDERRWRRLSARPTWVGPPRPGRYENITITPDRPDIPPRPIWIADKQQVVYREKLFGKFRGLLTYGSPLDKFAGMWPAFVPINLDAQAFPRSPKWINIFDRTDPVAASLKAYSKCALVPENFGYKASPWLLLGHLKYLTLHKDPDRKGREPADRIVDWLLTDHFEAPQIPGCQSDKAAGWYQVGGWTSFMRVASAYLQWFIIGAILSYVGVWALRFMLNLSGYTFKITGVALDFLDVKSACASDCVGMLNKLKALLPTVADAGEFALWAGVITFVIGGIGCLIRDDKYDPTQW